jgi:hypothetical protein
MLSEVESKRMIRRLYLEYASSSLRSVSPSPLSLDPRVRRPRTRRRACCRTAVIIAWFSVYLDAEALPRNRIGDNSLSPSGCGGVMSRVRE